jgi:hypothetical protein
MLFRVSWAVLVIAGVCTLVMIPWYGADIARTFHIDFVAFWCAGAATLQHQSPYLERSLHECELAHRLIPTLTVPVPYPPYAFALFGAFSLVPAGPSFWLWSALSIAAVAGAASALQRVSGVHWGVTWSALAALVLVPSLALGQVVPLAVCGLAFALADIPRERFARASLGFAVAALVPSFALPAWISAFIAVPRIRVPLAIAGFGLVILSVIAVGPETASAYAMHVVAAHASSEATAFWQLGWSAILYALGVSGDVSWAIALTVEIAAIAAGVVVGLRLAARYGGAQWVVASAAAFGIAGTFFVHGLDLAFALPLALMLLPAQPDRLLPKVAVLALCVPWSHLFGTTGVQALIVLPFLLIVADGIIGGLPLYSVAIVATLALTCSYVYRLAGDAAVQANAAVSSHAPAVLPPEALAEIRWRDFTLAMTPRAIDWYQRLPTYAALGAVLLAAIRAQRRD